MMRASILLLLLCSFLPCPLLQAAQASAANADKRLAAENSRREEIMAAAVLKAYSPPLAGVMPHPDEIPLSGAWEDPDWDTPLMLSIYKNPYSYANNFDNYKECLEEALDGNPKAMLALSMYCYLWGYVLEEKYPDYPPEVHRAEFWRHWAERLTTPGWVCLHLGDLHGRWPVTSLEYYRQAAELGNAEGMYNYYAITGDRKDYLYRSAALGNAKAALLVGEELEKLGGESNIALARRYIWLAALNGDAWGLLHSSSAFYKGQFAQQGDGCEQGYLYAVLSRRYQHGSSFSDQTPDNICMLEPDATSRLEAAADRWQADYEQRRQPHVLRARYMRTPEIEAMQGEMSGLMLKLGVKRRTPGDSFASGRAAKVRKPLLGVSLPWHLGFYSEGGRYAANMVEMDELAAHGVKQRRLGEDEYAHWLYAFVILSMLLGGAVMLGLRYANNKKLAGKQKASGE